MDGEPCRYLSLTKGLYAIVDADIYDWLMQWTWTANYANRSIDGKEVFYASRREKGKHISLHRQVMKTKKYAVDHRNRNTLDCRKSNLRPCTQGQNLANRVKSTNNTSGYKGVSWHPSSQRWHATVKIDGKTISGKYHRTPEDAARAYDAIIRKYRGEFAHTNFPIK